MLRRPASLYEHRRSKSLLKVKTFSDEEARVIGHEGGAGRASGMCGALVCETPDKRKFKVGSGLSDAQRRDPPKVGTVITYRYQELTKANIPGSQPWSALALTSPGKLSVLRMCHRGRASNQLSRKHMLFFLGLQKVLHSLCQRPRIRPLPRQRRSPPHRQRLVRSSDDLQTRIRSSSVATLQLRPLILLPRRRRKQSTEEALLPKKLMLG